MARKKLGSFGIEQLSEWQTEVRCQQCGGRALLVFHAVEGRHDGLQEPFCRECAGAWVDLIEEG